jgi:hypothetical protein
VSLTSQESEWFIFMSAQWQRFYLLFCDLSIGFLKLFWPWGISLIFILFLLGLDITFCFDFTFYNSRYLYWCWSQYWSTVTQCIYCSYILENQVR